MADEFFYHRQGAQGQLDGASNAVLDNEFGTHAEEEVIKQILEKGSMQESEVCSLFNTHLSHIMFNILTSYVNCSSTNVEAQRTTAWERELLTKRSTNLPSSSHFADGLILVIGPLKAYT